MTEPPATFRPPETRRFGYPVRLPASRGRSPLAIAGFIAIPLFFSSLMASTLAQEKAHVIQWNGKHGLITAWHDPTQANVARVWLWALLPPLVLVLVGFVAMRLPYGFYVPCVAAILIAMAVVHKAGTWERHHTARFPLGVDMIPASNPASDKYDPGQWEKMAHQTADSLQHWTIALALAAIVVTGGLAIRRRYFVRRSAIGGAPVEGVHAPDATHPGLGDPLA